MDHEARRELKKFLSDHVGRVKPLTLEANEAWWKLNTTGDPEWQAKSIEANERLKRMFADRYDFRSIEKWREQAVGADPEVRRQLDLIRLDFLAHQTDDATIRETVQLETDLEAQYASHRGEVRGEPVSDNRIHEILQKSDDTELRRETWEASKSIGSVVRPSVLRLVHLRNRTARRLGYRDHYAMALEGQEIVESRLLEILDDLELRTVEPFREAKRILDARLSSRFGVPVESLMPWHYSDPFFQEAPPRPELDLDQFFAAADIELITERTFRICGLSIEDVLKRSDLYERDKKNQHAFCSAIDREAKDVRVLCNVVPNERWAATMLHEFGHAVYDKYLDEDLPWRLMEPAHISTTEAIAMLFGRLATDPRWLRAVVRADGEKLETLLPLIAEHQRLAMLVFVRWGLVMVHFERQLYRDPEQDLDRLWWDTVQRLQMITPPPGRRAPDWAAKLHLALAPVYYHNYLLGELTASQLQHHIETRLPGEGVVKPETGDFLVRSIFRSGASLPWEETLERATGEKLSAKYFVKRYVDAPV